MCISSAVMPEINPDSILIGSSSLVAGDTGAVHEVMMVVNSTVVISSKRMKLGITC